MNFYETLIAARKHNIDALDLSCANTTEWFLNDYCNINETNLNYEEYFNTIASSVRNAYLKFEDVSFQTIENSLMDLKKCDQKLSIPKIAKYLEDYISGDLNLLHLEDEKEIDR